MNRNIKKLLNELDHTRAKFWNISKETGLFLNQLIRTTPNIKTILEIGTSNGVSAIWMAEALKAKKEKLQKNISGNALSKIPKPSVKTQKITDSKDKFASPKPFHLYTIESHKKLRYKLATENFQKAGLANYITQILGHAPEVIPSEPKYFDLIFLDATKYEHTDYLKAILPRTRASESSRTHRNSPTHAGSIIITDNAISHKKELLPYFKAVKHLKDFETHLIRIGSGLLISTGIF